MVRMGLVHMGLPYPSGNLRGFRGYLYSHTIYAYQSDHHRMIAITPLVGPEFEVNNGKYSTSLSPGPLTDQLGHGCHKEWSPSMGIPSQSF